MHECPECGQACDCIGDDTWNILEAAECTHECDEREDDWEYDQFVDEYEPATDCGRCQGTGEVPTADYESYLGAQMKPCPQCHGKLDGLGHGPLS